MAQDVFKLGKTQNSLITVPQPLGEMANEGETTYTEDSGRTKSGVNVVKPMFTVEQYSLEFVNLTKAQHHQLMDIVKRGKKIWMHYFSTSEGGWRTKQFYCGKYSNNIITLKNGEERFNMAFNVEGVKPL